jgi:hypothetical protein
MPYSAIVAGGKMWVLSTFGGRLFSIDNETGQADTWDVSTDRQWQAVFPRAAFLNNQRYDGYVREDMKMEVDGTCYRPAYGGLARCDGPRGNISPDISLPIYFAQLAKSKNGYFVTSPQDQMARYYSGGVDQEVSVEIGLDHWVVDNQVVGPEGTLDISVLEEKVLTKKGGAEAR